MMEDGLSSSVAEGAGAVAALTEVSWSMGPATIFKSWLLESRLRTCSDSFIVLVKLVEAQPISTLGC